VFDLDNLREILSTMKKNKLRTFLTGFSVAWGIFMLIVLLGAGNGLGNGIVFNFKDMATNTVTCWGRYTLLPYKGMQLNRRIKLNEKDVYTIKREHREVGYISPVNYRTDTITYNGESLAAGIHSVYPDYSSILFLPVPAGHGRFINEIDLYQRRKVIVLSPRMVEILFRKSDQVIGSSIKVGKIIFKVIGVYQDGNKSNDTPAYIPFTTGQLLYSDSYRVDNIRFTLNNITSDYEAEAFEKRFRERMAFHHHFDPNDKNAIGMWSTGSEFRMWKGMSNGIALFIWIIGIGTLMAGIVGVSNIMLITVRERTKEFGIRKAIGAKPSSILMLIIFESVLVTATFGYIGMTMGIGLTESINYSMEMANNENVTSVGTRPGDQTSVFRNPTVSLSVSLSATVVLVIAGVLAGYFPARKAVKISAIEAMRTE